MATKTKPRVRKPASKPSYRKNVKGTKSLGGQLALIQAMSCSGDDLTKVAHSLVHGRSIDLATAKISLLDLQRILDRSRGEEFVAQILKAMKQLKAIIAKAK
jgi:hypothetical protein